MIPPRSFPKVRLWLAAGGLSLSAVAILSFRHFHAGQAEETAADRPFRVPAVRREADPAGGPPWLTPDPAALRSGALITARLAATLFQPEIPAVGTVVDPVDLAETRAALATAESLADKARADLALANAEADRQRTLFDNNGAVSLQTLQAARGEQRLDEADARATTGTARLRREVALARFGPVLAGWMREGSTELDAVFQHRETLLLLTPLPGHPAGTAPPAEAIVTDYHGQPAPARLVSVAFRTDPRVQTLSYFYRVADDPVSPRFVPGMTLTARLPAGPAQTGVAVPPAAVVQRDGRNWAYAGDDHGRFRRREVSVANALPDGAGWFQAAATFPEGEPVVTAGTALLLAGEED